MGTPLWSIGALKNNARLVSLGLLMAWSSLALVARFSDHPQLSGMFGAASVVEDPSEWACDDLTNVPLDHVCEFVMTCESDSRIPYAQLYYCYALPRGPAAQLAFLAALMLAFLPLLFTLLCDASEFYMSPTMALLSQAIPGLQPRVAGVTFVAMGNGAPDLSSNINAIKSGSVLLSLGALTGASMFVQCIVGSEVIRLAHGVETRSAMLRDIGMYGMSIAGILLFFGMGKLTIGFVYWALAMYAIYVLSVVMGDNSLLETFFSFVKRRQGVPGSGRYAGFSWPSFRDNMILWKAKHPDQTVMMVMIDEDDAEGEDDDDGDDDEYYFRNGAAGDQARWPGQAGAIPADRAMSLVREDDEEGCDEPSVRAGGHFYKETMAGGGGRKSPGSGGGGGGDGAFRKAASSSQQELYDAALMFGDEPDLPVGDSASDMPSFTSGAATQGGSGEGGGGGRSFAKPGLPGVPESSGPRGPAGGGGGGGGGGVVHVHAAAGGAGGSAPSHLAPGGSGGGAAPPAARRAPRASFLASFASAVMSPFVLPPDTSHASGIESFARASHERGAGLPPRPRRILMSFVGRPGGPGGAPRAPRAARAGLPPTAAAGYAAWSLASDSVPSTAPTTAPNTAPPSRLSSSRMGSSHVAEALPGPPSQHAHHAVAHAVAQPAHQRTTSAGGCGAAGAAGAYDQQQQSAPASTAGQRPLARKSQDPLDRRGRRQLPASRLIDARSYMFAVWADHIHEQIKVEPPPDSDDDEEAGSPDDTHHVALSRALSQIDNLSHARNLSATSSMRPYASFLTTGTTTGSGSSGGPGSPSGRTASVRSSLGSFVRLQRSAGSATGLTGGGGGVGGAGAQGQGGSRSFTRRAVTFSDAHAPSRLGARPLAAPRHEGSSGARAPSTSPPPSPRHKGGVARVSSGACAPAESPLPAAAAAPPSDSEDARLLPSPAGSPAQAQQQQPDGACGGEPTAAAAAGAAGAAAAASGSSPPTTPDDTAGSPGRLDSSRLASIRSMSMRSKLQLGDRPAVGARSSHALMQPLLGDDGDGFEEFAEDGGEEYAELAPLTTWETVLLEVTAGGSEGWTEGGLVERMYRAAVTPLLLLPYTLIRSSLPLLDPGSYRRAWLLTTCAVCPMAVAFYLGVAGSVTVACGALAVGAAACGLVALATAGRGETEVPAIMLGTSMDFAPGLFSFIGFVVGCMWVDTIASEVVGILQLGAALLHIPGSVMGLTLMAWGNSLGDLAGNSALALNGLPAMALTACIASPLFNMLVSLAAGFSTLLGGDQGQQGDVLIDSGVAHVRLSADVALGCVFLIIYNGVMLVVGASQGALPRNFFLFARAWYGVYFVAATCLGFGLLDVYLPEWLQPKAGARR
ncbi:hypothetical protein FOA52_002912 [Chlamydomonas sp. UWO 241]|nr:hypothetical protein FOA52_002912 [Chlamydomonas sp. UWO 241]